MISRKSAATCNRHLSARSIVARARAVTIGRLLTVAQQALSSRHSGHIRACGLVTEALSEPSLARAHVCADVD
jgi:hypothetical protein